MIVGFLAIEFGREVAIAKSATLEWATGAFILLCAIATGFSVPKWTYTR
jgi:hypothetical protein